MNCIRSLAISMLALTVLPTHQATAEPGNTARGERMYRAADPATRWSPIAT